LDIIIKIDEAKQSIELEGLAIEIEENEDGWLAFCPDLKVLTYSNESQQKAIEDLKLAIDGFAKVHFEDGTIQNALQTLGWVAQIPSNNKGKLTFIKKTSQN